MREQQCDGGLQLSKAPDRQQRGELEIEFIG